MSEMVERVARILQDRDGSFMPGEPLDHVFVEDARAVIAAMREPTEAMVAAGWIDKEDVNPDDIWRAMNDEALR